MPAFRRYTQRHHLSDRFPLQVKDIERHFLGQTMPDNSKKFHEFALQSILFKGRSDWYFCYLKAEKIAHALVFLGRSAAPEWQEELDETARRAGLLPGSIAHLAGGEVDAPLVLADVFGLLSALRLLAARGALSGQNAQVLAHECEVVAERIVRGSNPSPFVSAEDFSVPQLESPSAFLSRPSYAPAPQEHLKDNRTKGHNKGQSERMSLILELVRKRKSLSIKEIASVIKGCSEKTIQRELAALISQGLVRKVGERRWSLYMPA
ncbi:DeoR family transcriptional regulator [Candidatus Kaiserbacteria bacterium]|nr:DeoR family transcriptional regulator [Candidatus Kaiserbacteria bacterium]